MMRYDGKSVAGPAKKFGQAEVKEGPHLSHVAQKVLGKSHDAATK